MIQILCPIPADQIRLLVFDLDGTLIDSRQDLCNSVNATLSHFGLAPLHDTTIASYIGDGAAMLIRRALAIPGEVAPGSHAAEPSFFEEAFEFFLAYYRTHNLDFTHLYPGVRESLNSLSHMPDFTRRPMAVLTNKPVGPALAICEGLDISHHFFSIYGGDSFETKKPDPLGLTKLMSEAAVTPEQTLMIGDSDVDLRTAQNAGAWSLACTFGLAPDSIHAASPNVIVDHASEWPAALGISQAPFSRNS